jgi:hypothetical protein
MMYGSVTSFKGQRAGVMGAWFMASLAIEDEVAGVINVLPRTISILNQSNATQALLA